MSWCDGCARERSDMCDGCGLCSRCCVCDDYDADELGLDPEERYDA